VTVVRCALLLLMLLAGASPAGAAGDVFATTTSYEVFGGTAWIDIDPPYTATLDVYQIHSDAVVRNYDRRWVFVVNRLFADNVLVLDRQSGYGVVTQYSVASVGLNPRDIHVEPSAGPGSAPGRAFIPLYESNSLLVCDALTGANATTIDLSVFADEDGLCEMDRILEVSNVPGYPQGLLFVSVQNQDRSGSVWVPTADARLALIDVATESLVDANPATGAIDGIDLQLTNPFWRMELVQMGSDWKILVNCPGSYGVADGGIEVVDPFGWLSEGTLIDEATVGGDILDFAVLGTAVGWVIRSDQSYRTSLVSFDPAAGTLGEVILTTPGFDLADLEPSLDGRLFVGDRTPTNPGIRIYDVDDGTLLAGPLDTGLPPFDLTLLDEVPVAAPPPRLTGRLQARPNPFNPRVEIRLEPAAPGSTPELEILDLRGRRIERLPGRRESTAVTWTWDGGGAPSGAYLARIAGSPSSTIKLMLVR
jgi:hypothetical protein